MSTSDLLLMFECCGSKRTSSKQTDLLLKFCGVPEEKYWKFPGIKDLNDLKINAKIGIESEKIIELPFL